MSLGARYAGGVYLRGDESNLNPRTSPYFVLNAGAQYRVSDSLEVFGAIENLLDTKYETFGSFSPMDSVPILQVPNADNPRSLSPGAPLAASAGVRLRL
jgi:outer membrane receptor protein involved in Fe transport